MEANALYQSAKKRVGNALSSIKARPKNALIDATRGALMGVTTDILGYPVDVASMAMQPFGYSVEKPVGGSDWLAERLTSPTGSAAETAGRFASGFLTPGPDDMMRMAGLVKPKAPVNELITYHSSPHRINNVDEANPVGRFDLAKVGTGEGNQAYGHGIYMSEDAVMNRNHYYKKFGVDPKAAESSWYNGKELGALPEKWTDVDANEFAARALSDVPAGLSNDEKAARVIRAARKQYPGAPLEFEDVLDDAARKATANAVERRKGHFYTVDLPDEHIAKMLDWDKPLSEQPESVRKALAEAIPEYKQTGFRIIDADGKQTIPRTYYDLAEAEADLATYNDKWAKSFGGATLKEVTTPTQGQYIYSLLSDHAGGKEKASALLQKHGVPGIRYLDGGSRGAGEGTRNFVIFDGDTAKILKRE